VPSTPAVPGGHGTQAVPFRFGSFPAVQRWQLLLRSYHSLMSGSGTDQSAVHFPSRAEHWPCEELVHASSEITAPPTPSHSMHSPVASQSAWFIMSLHSSGVAFEPH
jgi:hypothetical protein